MSRWAYNMSRECVRGLNQLQRAREADARRAEREQQRAYRDAQIEAQARYVASRHQQAEEMSATARQSIDRLESLFSKAVSASRADILEFSTPRFVSNPLIPPPHLAKEPRKPIAKEYADRVKVPSWFGSLSSKRMQRYRYELSLEQHLFERHMKAYEAALARRTEELESLETQHARQEAERKAQVDAATAELALTSSQAEDGDFDAITVLIEAFLRPSPLHEQDQIAWHWSCHVDPDSSVALLDVALPSPSVIPTAKGYRYIQKHDEIREISLSQTASRRSYRHLLAGIMLCGVHRCLLASPKAPETVVCNGWRSDWNPATGLEEVFCAASISVQRDSWQRRSIEQCDPAALFKDLRGRMKAKAEEFSPVKPFRLCPSGAVESIDS